MEKKTFLNSLDNLKKLKQFKKSLYIEYELQQLRDYGYVKYPVKKSKK